MTKNEVLAQIAEEAYAELCTVADKHRGNFKPIYGLEANEKWWCVLYPAIHVAIGRDFNTGMAFGLTFPSCDISVLPISFGSKFIFPSRESAEQFGYEAKDLLRTFLYPESTLILKRTR